MTTHKKIVIGVIGSWNATEKENARAFAIGAGIAKRQWVTLTGGEPGGVMQSASKGAAEAGGLVIGILPGTRRDAYSPYVHIPVFTNAGFARDYYNVLSSDVVICASHLSSGTFTEALLAIKSKVPLVVLTDHPEQFVLLKERGGDSVHGVDTVEDAFTLCETLTNDY